MTSESGSAVCLLLSTAEARAIIDFQLQAVAERWQHICGKADRGGAKRNAQWGRHFLNSHTLQWWGVRPASS